MAKGTSIVRALAQQTQKKKNEGNLYNSHGNYILYGETGKSSISASLSLKTEAPVLIISPAGGSSYLSDDFPNAIFYPLNDLQEMNTLLDDLSSNMKEFRALHMIVASGDEERLESAKKYYAEEFDYMYKLATKSEYPISAIVVEEISIISSWIQDEVESSLDIVSAGEDKTRRGSEWNVLRRKIMEFYSKILKLPCMTILCTGSRLPSEQQGSNQITPNLCVGAAQRDLIQTIGNLFYCYKNDKNEYLVRISGDKKIMTKDKILSPFSNQKCPDEINVTNRPEYLWELLNDMKTQDIKDRQSNTMNKSEKKTK